MLKLILKLMLFLPILLGMMYFSYRIDPSGLFWGAGFERIASEYMLQGNYISGYERLDGRALNEVFAKNIPYAPQILINGSSRSLSVNKDCFEGKTFYNSANVGADIYDFFTSYYIFAKENKDPETIILSIDPWIFNSDESAIDKRSNKELYYQFIGEELGIENDGYEKPNYNAKYEALVDPSYFQGSVRYFLKDNILDHEPQIVDEKDIYKQKDVIKCYDGSIIYDEKYRNFTQEEVDFIALTEINATLLRIEDFDKMDKDIIYQFELFIDYLQNKGIEIVIFLPPYHPFFYEKALQNKDEYSGFFAVEEYCIKFAKKNDIPLVGSYDAEKIGLTNEDFYDSLHAKPEAMYKIFNPEEFSDDDINEET